MLNDEQKETVRAWATEGADLAQIHQRIRDDLGVAMTYFDARMLVSELEVSLDKPEEEKEELALEEEPQAEEQDSSTSTLVDEREAPMCEPEPAQGGGSVSVTVDTIALPQSMVSGKVTFSDGMAAAWSIDQMGRLGLDPDQPGYQPEQEDLMAFQKELQSVLKSQGF